jgi:hypothetical protein
MCDWTEFDTSRIPPTDFPIRCDRCDDDLTGLGEVGRCPQCGLRFVRRERLWKTYGPDAFAEPPVRPGEDESSSSDKTFLYGLFWGLVLTLLLPIVIYAWLAVFGTIDLCFCLFVWAFVAFSAEWIVIRRLQERAADGQSDRGSDSD